MASYKKEENGTYSIRYRHKDINGLIHNKQKRGFKKLSEAKQYYEIYIAPLLNEKLSVSTTLNSIYDSFLQYKKMQTKESSYLSIKQTCDTFIINKFGDKNIHEIQSLDLIKWQTEIDSSKNNYSHAYKSKLRHIFSNLLNYAVENHGLKANPFNKVKGFVNKEPKKEMLYWIQEEFEKFIDSVDNIIYKNLFLTLYLTGCRKGEIIGLQWSDIDFKKNIIKISKTYSRKTIDKGFKLTAPKTAGSNREILMPDVLINSLKEYLLHCKKDKNFNNSYFVFGGISPLPEVVIDRNKNYYCKKAEVKQIRMQDFRHSHASLLINNQQNILIVAQRLGHSNIEQTLNTYSHLFPNQQKELLKSLDIKIKK